jgi:SCY1-like protein 1
VWLLLLLLLPLFFLGCPGCLAALQSGDWFLAGFEMMTAPSTSAADWPSAHFREHDEAVDIKFKSLERAKGNWDLLASSPLHAMDIWSYACLLFEVLVRPMRAPTDIRDSTSLPRTVASDYQRMLATSAASRVTASTFLQSGYFKQPFVQALQFLDELALKDKEEKLTFFQHLSTVINTFPSQACKYKVWPAAPTLLRRRSPTHVRAHSRCLVTCRSCRTC